MSQVLACFDVRSPKARDEGYWGRTPRSIIFYKPLSNRQLRRLTANGEVRCPAPTRRPSETSPRNITHT